jgi:hypothetical protein
MLHLRPKYAPLDARHDTQANDDGACGGGAWPCPRSPCAGDAPAASERSPSPSSCPLRLSSRLLSERSGRGRGRAACVRGWLRITLNALYRLEMLGEYCAGLSEGVLVG